MNALYVALWLGALWLAGALLTAVAPEHLKRPDESEAMTARQESASATLLGEFSSGLAEYLWRKTDEYTHGGVLMRPITEAEREHGAHADCTSDPHGHQHNDDHDHVSVVPHKADDPRGIWGDIEREVQPYFDEHSHIHRPVTETLPLYRFMTWLDPKFVPGYTVGAFVIRHATHGEGEVKSFLAEGLCYNPKSVALRVELARCLMREKAPSSSVMDILWDAVRLGREPNLPEWEVEGRQDAYRWLAILLRHEGRPDEASRVAAEGLALFPDDTVLRKLSSAP
ncbi:MAG: tetratricopeptide repeat protein [Fimbriimonadia bacterium]|jgi:hypothetical protein